MSDDRRTPPPNDRDAADLRKLTGSASDDPGASDDLELGSALGRALREQAGSVGEPPPVGLIAERAAARAKARVVRRTVTAVAASVVVLGGVLAWNSQDRSGTVVVSAADPDERDPDSATGESTGPASSPSSQGTSSGAAAGSGTDAPPGALDDPVAQEDGSAEPTGVTPEGLSTGPVLQWTEIDPGFVDLYRLEPVGDGRVLARGWRDAGPIENPAAVEQVVVTANGIDWTDVPMPAGIMPRLVDISGDRWVVTGEGGPSDAPGEARSVPAGPGRAFFSDDEGATWTELALNLPPGPAWASPYVIENSQVVGVLVSGKNIVLVVTRDTGLDLYGLLQGRDLVPEGRSVVGWSTTRLKSIEFDLADGPPPDDAVPPILIAYGGGSAGGVGGSGWGPPVESVSLTYDELGMTDEERAVLDNPGYGRVLLLAGDGSAMEAVAEYEGWPGSGLVTAEGFVLTVSGPEGAVVTSPDGRLWSKLPSSEFWPPAWGVVTGGTIWDATTDHLGTLRTLTISRGRFGEAAMSVVATFEGLQSAGRLAAGPAGVVATAHPAPDGAGSEVIDSVLPEGRIAKDGYELRYNEPEGGITLWDFEADAAVYVFGPEDRQGDQPPAGVRESSEDGEFALVFEDPETGADLVTFTYEDLAPVFEAGSVFEVASGSDSASVDLVGYEMPETWVGWSADGSAWGWQTMADAFGVDNASPGAQFAVGGDFVIARVDVAQVEEVEVGTNTQGDWAFVSVQTSERQLRLFIARVP